MNRGGPVNRVGRRGQEVALEAVEVLDRLLRVERAAGQAVVFAHLRPERLARQLRGLARSHLRTREAQLQLHADRLQRQAGAARLVPALLRERARGVRGTVLSLGMTEEPDHARSVSPALFTAFSQDGHKSVTD